MKVKLRVRRPGVLALPLFLLAAWMVACSGASEANTVYHCPMHPTYVSDQPGDCPICNMRLVPLESGSMGADSSTDLQHSGSEEMRYHCPMHPTYISDRPGSCPICHMNLVPIEAVRPSTPPSTSLPEGYSVVEASPNAVFLSGIQTVAAELDTVERNVRAVGTVRADETRIHQVNTRFDGWVRRLSANFTGQFVRRGDPLLTVYSPELLASQEEYLNSLEAVRRFEASRLPEVQMGASDLLDASRSRLLLFGVPEALIALIESTGEAQPDVVLEAPATGYITGKEVFVGARIEPGMTLFTISDLSSVWIEAEIYEYEAQLVSLGSRATVSLPYDSSFDREGRVTYVYPTLDPMTRTIRVRLELENSDLTLKPDMFANVWILAEQAYGVIIPDDAILDSGTRQIVFVMSAPGVFEPREIRAGIRSAGTAQILSGVAAGEQVVVRANFLLDSESRLRAAISGMPVGHQHGASESSDGPTVDVPAGPGTHGGHQ